MPSSTLCKAYHRSIEKNIQNKMAARTHPCFTPLRISKLSQVEPSNLTELFMLS
jgi:hypothetical protein